jgi:hypothetical protein
MLEVAGVSLHLELDTVETSLGLAATISDGLIYTVEALTESLLNCSETSLYSELVISLRRHNRTGGETACNIVCGSYSTEFITEHIAPSISGPAVISAPTTKEKEQYPPALVPTIVVTIADALTYSHAFRKFTHLNFLL